MPDYTYCDYDALPAEGTRASLLTSNRFYKLCPGAHLKKFGSGGDDGDGYGGSSSSAQHARFGMPRCGDGSNFSFFFSRPLKQYSNDRKIIIEFQGESRRGVTSVHCSGGACWDEETCGMQQEYLAIPEYYDSFVGMSCSEIEYGAAVQGDNPLSLLCAKKIGKTDFREYNTIIVPYWYDSRHVNSICLSLRATCKELTVMCLLLCLLMTSTQDVHIGDAPDVYYDGNTVVQHLGAHNMVRTLKWVFTNFPTLTHVFLTGCSAGGTAVPIAYDLINKHYNRFGPRRVNINAIMDSSVYLTPSYFLQNSFPNWNPVTIMSKKLRFNYNKYSYQENYPDLVWDHILKRGSNRDQWGFVTHISDPVSLMFYEYMSGDGDGDGNRVRSLEKKVGVVTPDELPSSIANGLVARRHLSDLESQWWAEISESMDYVKRRHHNVNTYVIESEGHCSFGLYYPLQEEGFEEWAAPIVREGMVAGSLRQSLASFFTGLALGGALIYLTRRMKRAAKQDSLMEGDTAGSGWLGESVSSEAKGEMENFLKPLLVKVQSVPWTTGYLLTISFYFIGMLIVHGFAHPLDNPTLGPSAVGLSAFGINNPALIIYRMQHIRLITSSFLCSGLITYLCSAMSLYNTGLEASMMDNKHSDWHFPLVAALLSFGINLTYGCIGKGASCSSLALVLGLNVFSSTMRRRYGGSYPSSLCFTLLVFILGCTPLFPFDSLVALTVALIIGIFIGRVLFVEDSERQAVRWGIVKGMCAVYFFMYIMLLFRVPRPDKHNLYPFLTGCNFVYSDQIGDFVSAYTNGGGRALEGDGGDDWFDGENMCAQICLPHLIYRSTLWGAHRFTSIPLEKGTCEEQGYDEHIAGHTMREFTVTFEVLLFTSSNGDGDN
ncbi:hypothetical protein ACHAWF_018100 [Thalassiosira exigua]